MKNIQILHVVSCKLQDDTKLENAKTAEECFMILCKEKCLTPSDVIAMQFLLKGTKDVELEKECIKYAKEMKALHYFEKPPGNILYNLGSFQLQWAMVY